MNEVLQIVLEEQQRQPLPPFTTRDVRVPILDGLATAIVGMRRVGKSYLLQQTMSSLQTEGVPREAMLFLNLEDDRLQTPDLETLDQSLEYAYRTGPGRGSPLYLLLDEIQVVPGWERFVLRVLNTEQGVHILVTGSSAKLLSTEIATSLRGRSLSAEVLPFGFREYVRHHGLEPTSLERVGATQRSSLEAAYDRYLDEGGFPGVQSLIPMDRRRLLQDYVELVTFRDVVERWEVGNLVALRWMVQQLMSSFSRHFSVNRMLKDLKSQGVKVGKDTLHTYLGHLIDARLFYTVGVRRSSYRARQVNPRKVYAADPGLAHAAAHPSADDLGHLLENAVYLELRRRYGRLHDDVITYFSHEGTEVDFVIDRDSDEPMVVQVCADLSSDDTRERELRGARVAMRELGVNEATIVTLYQRDSIEVEEGVVRVVPAWRWSLGG
jgi:predicted AAA+ superfamily ATPase